MNKEFNLLMRCKWVRRYIDDLIALSMPVFVKLRYIEDRFKSPETNRWVKGIYPELPVVMISGHGTVETAVQAIRNGAYDFIEKPFKADRLVLTVTRAVEAARAQ